MRNCFTVWTARTYGAGAVTQPVFHPVTENDLPADDTDTVRSRIPSRVASGMCSVSSKVRYSYTSSVIATRSCSRHTSAMASSSPRVNTVPAGLCGEFTRIARVRGPAAARSSSGSNVNRPSTGRSMTGLRTAPASAITAA